MHLLKDEDEQGFVSESTLTSSSISVDLCKSPESSRTDTLMDFKTPKPIHPVKSTHLTRKCEKTPPKTQSSFKVRRKLSLIQCLEKQPLFKKKTQNVTNPALYLSPRSKHYKMLVSLKNELSDSDCKGSGDFITTNKKNNQVQFIYPVTAEQPGTQVKTSRQQKFPFKSTPSGNYKLKPSQVVYESKNVSIVAADPKSIMLNISDSSKTLQTESLKKSENENWATTCLYTTVGSESKIPFGSELSDTISESDEVGMFTTANSGGKPSELSLAKMGYVTDGCIDWKKFTLPNKSELQKVLLKNILNMVNTDIHVKIGTNVYKCHRIVLQCYCTYFTSKTESQVELSEASVSGETFSLIYQWMLHMGGDSYQLLRRDNILDLFKAARFLGVKELEDQCWAFIDNLDIFSEDRALLLYMEARKHGSKDIMELMVPRIQRFFLTLVSSKEFVELSCEEVCTFLRSNYICIHCEMEVFMAGVRWLSHDWQGRKQHIVDVMSCVRFGFFDPQILIAMKRNPQSQEFMRITNISEVSDMIDDGVAFAILKNYFKDKPPEEFQKSLKTFRLSNPIPRNWAGTDKSYQSYADFLKDLAHYRSKQRLEIKKSKMKIEMEKVDDDDFLSSAVLLPDTQLKIKKLTGGHHSLNTCLPQLEQKELDLLKKMVCQNERVEGEKSRQIKSKLYSMAEEEYKKKPVQRHVVTGRQTMKRQRGVPVTFEEQDIAARKIQRAYRGYSKRKGTSIRLQDRSKRQEVIKQQSIKDRQTPGDTSVPSHMLKSSTHPAGICEEIRLPLKTGNKTVFIFGGSNPYELAPNNSGQMIYQYQPKSNTWKKCGELPEPRHYHCVVYFQGQIYVAGGKNPEKNLSEPGAISRKVWRLDPEYMGWSRIKDMTRARRSFGFVVCNNKLFVVGGRDEYDRVLANVEKYDINAERWMEVRPMNVPRAGAAISVFNDHIWVAGGLINEQNVATDEVEYYNYQYNMWNKFVSLRYTLGYGVMVPVQDKLFLVGGAIGLPNTEVAGSGKQIDGWDDESQMWCLASTMSKPRHAHAAVYLRGVSATEPGYIFIMGGMSTKRNCVTDNVECWLKQGDHFIAGVAPLPHPMSGLAALCLPTDIMN